MKSIIEVFVCQSGSQDFVRCILPNGDMKFKHMAIADDKRIKQFAKNIGLSEYEVVRIY